MEKLSLLLAMRLFVAAVVVSSIGLITPVSVIAQEVEGCFMVDSSGRQISLGGLCQGGSVPVSRQQSSQGSGQEQNLAIIYALEYCDYRRSNRTRTESSDAAFARLTPFLTGEYNSELLFDLAFQQIEKQCPGL